MLGSLLRKHALKALLPFALACLVTACGGDSTNSSLASGSVDLHDQTWYCGGPVEVDRLKVTISRVDSDAIHLGRGCTGRIGEIVVIQYRSDGVKVSAGAHDIVIEKGTIECRAQKPDSHQDGVQAMGGARVTFNELRINCPTRSSGFFVRKGGRGDELPTDIVCDGCYLRGGSYSLRVNESVRSGARNSTICDGRFGAVKILEGAVDPVYEGNDTPGC